jgi:hypothetical protein
MEHRWGKRVTLSVAVRLRTHSGHAIPGRIENASLSGAFVRTSPDFPPFAHVLLEIEGAPVKSQPIDAYVVRVTPEGLGLEWAEFAPPVIATLLARASARRPGSLMSPTTRGVPRTPRYLPAAGTTTREDLPAA